MCQGFRLLAVLGLAFTISPRASAESILFSPSPDPNNLMAMALRPGLAGITGIEAADDFFTTSAVRITSATFTGLLTSTNSTVSSPTVSDWKPMDDTTALAWDISAAYNAPKLSRD